MSKIKIIRKNDEYSLEYQVGDIFEVQGTWYGGVHIAGRTGVPVSLDKEEYLELPEEGDTWNPEVDKKTDFKKYDKIRQEVLDAVQDAVEQGLIKGTSGNIALKDEADDVVAITPSGVPYKGMKLEDIALVDLDGNWIDGPYKPSSELQMHLAVLRRRPDIRATVHTHALYATIVAMGEHAELKPITPPQCEFAPVKIIPYVMPGSLELAEKIGETLGKEGRVALLKNHGMFSCGKNMFAAMEASAYTEEMATATMYSRLLGTYEPMQEDDVKKVQDLIASSHAV